jgi:AcrR family transcriptional regulator
MSPRPRKVSDSDIYAATYRAMQRLGPRELTLAEIAAEAGVTAGAIAQRFGSKRALLLSLSEGAAASAGDMLRAIASSHESPLAAVRAYAECMAGLASSPVALARNLAYLQVDLADDEFRAHLKTQGRATREGIQALLDEAVAARELVPDTDTETLARNIELALNGALFTWAVYQDGNAIDFLRDAVNVAIAPYVPKRRAS